MQETDAKIIIIKNLCREHIQLSFGTSQSIKMGQIMLVNFYAVVHLYNEEGPK